MLKRSTGDPIRCSFITGKVVLDELGLDVEVYYSSEINPDAKLVATYHHCPTHLGDAVQLNRAQVGIYVLHPAVKFLEFLISPMYSGNP